jgi:DNA-binding NarL/FixJ family response regulator
MYHLPKYAFPRIVCDKDKTDIYTVLSPIYVSIAEDNSFAMRSCLDKLSRFDNIKILHKAANGAELMQQLADPPLPDVVLMDIEMPVMDGIECTRTLKKKHPQIPVLMLTTFDDDEKIFSAIMAGASGYLLKEESGEQLYKAIAETQTGGAAMSATIALKVLHLLRNPISSEAAQFDFDITPRETQILEQLKNGLSYDQIANNLFISNGTVRKHIQNIYRKLQVTNKVDAVQKGIQNRII